MKKILFTAVCGVTMLTGCQYGGDNEALNYEEQANGTEMLNVANNNEYNNDFVENQGTEKFGYVRMQQSPVEGRDNYYIAGLNKEHLANSISGLITQLPGIEDVGTLVTSEEVLIAYQADTEDRVQTADQVKKTAISMVPRYYHVYVSDEQGMISEIERYGQWSPQKMNNDRILDSTIKDMLRAPQGKPLNSGENENGESIDGMNEKMDNDNVHLRQDNQGM